MYSPLKKSYEGDLNDLVEEQLEKGGPGSGRRPGAAQGWYKDPKREAKKKTAKEKLEQQIRAEQKKESTPTDEGKEVGRSQNRLTRLDQSYETAIGRRSDIKANKTLSESEKTKKLEAINSDIAEIKAKYKSIEDSMKKSQTIADEIKEILSKGGPGSGRKGHKTNNKNIAYMPKFGAHVKIDKDGTIWTSSADRYTGKPQLDESGEVDWVEVTHPEPGFKEAVNRHFNKKGKINGIL